MAGLITPRHPMDRRPDEAPLGTWTVLLRAAIVSLVVLTLLILLSAPAARGVATAPGDLVWMSWIDGPAHDLDAITSVAAAPDGSLFAAGTANDDWAAGGNMLLVKKTPSGGTGSWSLEWDGPSLNADSCNALVVDGKSNAVMVGTSVTGVKGREWALVKYSSTRTFKWQKLWGSAGDDWAIDAAGDTAGNVYVCGTYHVSPTQTDWKVVKFSGTSGSRAWTCTYAGPAVDRSGDMPLAMTRDAGGNVYVSGLSRNTSAGYDIVVIKVSPKGDLLWKRRIDGPSHLTDQGVEIAAAPGGGVYVAAESWTGTAQNRLLLVRLGARGGFSWATKWRLWDDPAVAGLTSVEGLELDGAGNVYVAGYSWDPNLQDSRAFVQKRDANGRLRWERFYRPAGVGDSAFNDLVVSSVGRVWVAGSQTPAGGTQDWLLARYETNGTRAWASGFDTPSHLADWVIAITLCGTRGLFAGGVMGTATNDDAGTGKYLR